MQIANRDVVAYSIILRNNLGDKLMHINELSPHYDPLRFPLLFPIGTYGWHPQLLLFTDTVSHEHIDKKSKLDSAENIMHDAIHVEQHHRAHNRISMREFYAYHLMYRNNASDYVLHTGRVLQEYVVDMYSKIEGDRLNWIKQNQSTLKADLYHGKVDQTIRDTYVHTDSKPPTIKSTHAKDTEFESHIDKANRFILPSTFLNSERSNYEKYLDSMAIPTKHGKADLFITMTCNPNWPEIKQQCMHNDVDNRSDIIARIFKAKLQILKDDILIGSTFGKTIAYLESIEFQKRGLPHAHILIWLHADDKPKNPADYDRFVSAEIPDAHLDPELYKHVQEHMIHGPCGHEACAAQPDSTKWPPCMIATTSDSHNVACMRNYPKAYHHETSENEDGCRTTVHFLLFYCATKLNLHALPFLHNMRTLSWHYIHTLLLH